MSNKLNQEQFKVIRASVQLAIDRVLARGTDDVFRPPLFSRSIESMSLDRQAEKFRKDAERAAIDFLKHADLTRSAIGPIRKCLVPKDENTFRAVAWLDPFDAVRYLSLATIAFRAIEPHRPAKKLRIVHSHRASDDWQSLFDENYGYDSFRAESTRISADYIGKWKVVTDIANFFDRIGNHPLENHLLDCRLDEKYAKLIREVLLFWAGDRRSFGVPVGSDASRVLSEAVLLAVDKKLVESGVKYVRYVDDFRIFAETKAQALNQVALLTELLAEEGLSLNSRKTEIFQVIEPSEIVALTNRFATGEHEVIDIEEKIEVKRRIRVSGQTSISKFYRRPGKEALKKIKEMPRDEIEKHISDSEDYQFETSLKIVVKYFVYAEQDVKLISALLKRRMTSVIYLADALTKEVDHFSQEKLAEIKSAIFEKFDWQECAYPLLVPILRLASCAGFFEPKYARQIVDRHATMHSMVFFREAINLGAPCLDRHRLRLLATKVFPNVPDFVQRAIFGAIAAHDALSEDEKRPLMKNMTQSANNDWFITNWNG